MRTIGEIADSPGVTRQAVGEALDSMVERGCVERRPDESDRRRVELTPTRAGEQAAVVARDVCAATEGRLVEALGQESSGALRAGLTALVEAELREGPQSSCTRRSRRG